MSYFLRSKVKNVDNSLFRRSLPVCRLNDTQRIKEKQVAAVFLDHAYALKEDSNSRSLTPTAGEISSYLCHLCATFFEKKNEFQKHMLSHDGKSHHECNLLPAPLQSEPISTRSTCVDEKKPVTSDRSRNFEDKPPLKSHIVLNERPFVCPYCSKGFKSKGNLKIHVSSIHTCVNRLQCSKCPATFNQKPNLMRHLDSVHSEKRPFICNHCGKNFKTKSSVDSHIKFMHSGELFFCPHCSKEFKGKLFLAAHISNKHTRANRAHQCLVCKTTFYWKCHLRKHLKIVHGNERPYTCDDCGAKFKIKASLKTHILSQNCNKKILLCDHCEKRFRKKIILKRHMMEHCCRYCPATFKYRLYLRQHLTLTHSKDG